jgi:NAD(P)-dependent dehydrogenase (short-subunit alcohol dehydrogenase family)
MTDRGAITELFDLTGKVAVVTGGSRGLGRSMVLALAEAGADVVVSSRKADACEEVAALVREQTGRRALAHACHVANWDELEPLADAAYAEFGKVDVLVNNAGMSPLYDTVLDVTEDLWDKVLGVNLKGPFRLSAVIGSRMAEGDGGSIINVSSTGAVRPYGGIAPYSAAKAGLHALTMAMAHALAPTVRVNCIMPGAFLTDVTAWWGDDMKQGAAAAVPLGRIGEPDEIVGATLWLASAASSYVTGGVIPVTGGAA